MPISYVRGVILNAFFISIVNAASTPVKYEDLLDLHEPITEETARGFYRAHFGAEEKRSPAEHDEMLKETGSGLLEQRFAGQIFRERMIGLAYVGMNPLTEFSQLFDEQVEHAGGSILEKMVYYDDCAGVDYMLTKADQTAVQAAKARLSAACRELCMVELLLNRGIAFDLFNQFSCKNDGRLEALLIEREASVSQRSIDGLNPLLWRINATYGFYCCAGFSFEEEALREACAAGNDMYVLVNAGVGRHDRASEEFSKHYGSKELAGKTAAEFLRDTLLIKDEVPGYAEVANYIDRFGTTLVERIVRSVILKARDACDGDEFEPAIAALAQLDALPRLLENSPENSAVLDRCLGELWPIIEQAEQIIEQPEQNS